MEHNSHTSKLRLHTYKDKFFSLPQNISKEPTLVRYRASVLMQLLLQSFNGCSHEEIIYSKYILPARTKDKQKLCRLFAILGRKLQHEHPYYDLIFL